MRGVGVQPGVQGERDHADRDAEQNVGGEVDRAMLPRWLSSWGLAGAALTFVYGLLGILGRDTGLGSPCMLLAMPIAVQELVFAGWLTVRGFADHSKRSGNPLARRPARTPVAL